jgi:hypothetical protein
MPFEGAELMAGFPTALPGVVGGKAIVTKMPTITQLIEGFWTKLPLMLEKK